MILYPVTTEHYEKYRDLAIRLNVQFSRTTHKVFGFDTFGEFFAYQSRDPALTNLPPAVFETWIESMRVFNKQARTLAKFELICLAKYCLLAHTLNASPRFITKKEIQL